MFVYQTRRETERQMIAFIDERCSMLQNEIMKQTKERSENVGMLEDELEADFPKLQDCNQAESHERQEQDSLLIKRVVEEAETISKTVSAERKAREASEEQVLELIKNMVDTIKYWSHDILSHMTWTKITDWSILMHLYRHVTGI